MSLIKTHLRQNKTVTQWFSNVTVWNMW